MDAYVEKDAVEAGDDRRRPLEGPPPAPSEPAPPKPAGTTGTNGTTGASGAGGGIMALSLPYQVVVAVALAVTGVFACVHLAMVFLHVAPSNTLTKQNGQAVDDWIYPEFEQNWKLFAPNPLQQNVSIEVRAELATADGGRRTTGWIDLTAQDIGAIRHNPMPSHTQQNQLRRAVDFYFNSHNDEHRPNGLRGRLSEQYMRRIAVQRLDALPSLADSDVRRIQLRAVTRPVPAPWWGTEKSKSSPSYRDFPWWRITDADRSPAAGADPNRTDTAQNRTEEAR
ncbi:DUF5819 family protein [Streptomyces cinereoruber]|uniref:DUF5819 family protein n=1 Tax=Streptomyces cinereoruber TaxID=67260 RepID=UPI00363A223A